MELCIMVMVVVAFLLTTIDSKSPLSNLSKHSNTETSLNQLKRDLQTLLRDGYNAGS
jgi:hypothetical protein